MLALALGMTVRELLARMDSRELAEWMAYYQLEPFGGFRGDLHAGLVCSTIANANKGKRGKPFTPADFMPLNKPDNKEQTEDDMRGLLEGLARGT